MKAKIEAAAIVIKITSNESFFIECYWDHIRCNGLLIEDVRTMSFSDTAQKVYDALPRSLNFDIEDKASLVDKLRIVDNAMAHELF